MPTDLKGTQREADICFSVVLFVVILLSYLPQPFPTLAVFRAIHASYLRNLRPHPHQCPLNKSRVEH